MNLGTFLEGTASFQTFLGGAVAALAGCVGGATLVALVGRPLDAGVFAEEGAPRAPTPTGSRRWIVAAAMVSAVALWWWEVCSLGLEPAVAGEDGAGFPAGIAITLPPGAALAMRCLAHALLAWLLAAAAWIDIRHRVIPDGVTVPGVILGLATVWACPDVLLPIATEVPRSYAPPLLRPDVLGWYGGLAGQSPPLALAAAPHLAGLVVPLAIFALWWWVCTAPWLDPSPPGRFPEPRNMLLIGGLVAIAAAWWTGGPRFLGLQSALVGSGVSAALVWSVREGASRSLGREAMGLGDVTLMGMVGAWIGWQAGVLAFFMAAFIGLFHGLAQVVRHRENELPYGPSLCLASAVAVVAWRPLWQRVGGLFAQPLELFLVVSAVVVLTAVTLLLWRRLRG